MEKENKSIDCYQRVYMEYAPMLLRFAGKFVSSFFAEDIVHDIFLKLWDKQVFLLPDEELKKILYVSIRNACIDHLRHSHMEKEILDQRAIQLQLDELDYFESSDELFMRKDLMEILMKILSELPEKSQEIFRLSYLKGIKAAEIAEQLGLSVRTVENHLYRSLLYMRKHSSHLFFHLFYLI